MKHVEIYTDGACKGNPGAGGWAAVLLYGTVSKEISGGCANTTNNKMELTAVIESLKALKEPCNVTITTDSKYVSDAINKGWLNNWVKSGWVNSSKKPVKNVEMWKELLKLLNTHTVKFVWVKGHADCAYNVICDRLAVAESNKF